MWEKQDDIPFSNFMDDRKEQMKAEELFEELSGD